jgi:signal transduction histidine kinase
MRLDRFIHAHMEDILAEWEAFAQTLLPAAGPMSDLALRDHARQILQDIALDIETTQNPAEQQQKSQGLAADEDDGDSAASIHGALRQASHFSLLQLSAEFRALRATVLRLWLPQVGQMSASTSDQMVRFNEAIDQALAESVVTYSARADQMRELFLAVLGHDLRAPLSSMSIAGELLMRPELAEGKAAEHGARIKRGARLMATMVDDLIGYTSTQLGAGLPTVLAQADLGAICQAAADDAGSTHPLCRFELTLSGELHGQFDPVRLQQLLTNLMTNAAQYGGKDSPVRISARGAHGTIKIEVNNDGPVIPAASLEAIFQPLVQLPAGEDDQARPRTSLGLGLYIAREIALAHGGALSATSSEQAGTTFTVSLPALPPQE